MINHVEIYVENINKELIFWNKILSIFDFKVLEKWSEGFSIGINNKSYICFNETAEREKYKRRNVGINHIAICTTKSKKDIQKFLKKENIKLLYLNKNEKNIFIENEWGLKIEIVF